ncbi:hypothetical protein Tco_1283215 [Tanacetum coccineum]
MISKIWHIHNSSIGASSEIGIADDIASKFQNISIKSVLSKIVFGAAVYFVWQERTKDNSQRKKGLENLVEVIINIVRLRLSSISTIKTTYVELVEKEWDVKCRSVQKFNGWISMAQATRNSEHGKMMLLGPSIEP